MRPYTPSPKHFDHIDNILGERIKQVDGQWYWTDWHVCYAQKMTSIANHVTKEDAEKDFQQRLVDLRKSWAWGGRNKPAATFSEVVERDEPEHKRIRFRTIRKDGKFGRTTGVLYMHRITCWGPKE